MLTGNHVIYLHVNFVSKSNIDIIIRFGVLKVIVLDISFYSNSTKYLRCGEQCYILTCRFLKMQIKMQKSIVLKKKKFSLQSVLSVTRTRP